MQKKLESRIEKYPFLSYPYLEEKILYDPHGFAKRIKQQLLKYFKENPEPKKVWEKWLKEYIELKKKKVQKTEQEKEDLTKKFYDQLEIKFSKNHKITRNWFKSHAPRTD